MRATAIFLLAGLCAAPALFCLDRQASGGPGLPAIPPLAAGGESGRIAGVKNGMLELDRNDDGRVDYALYNDAAGSLAREELDFNLDGKMDDVRYYRAGVAVREEIDSDFDGRTDIWVHILNGEYIERYERDTDGDGEPDVMKSFGG
ncbi:MAG: hypothetical protein NT005_06320 [Spirochaetes bacterium]|jgi:hypothetical protein|nr:hypothetical protein [Spirochaetota bacterium]